MCIRDRPKACIAFIFLTIVFFLYKLLLAFAKQADITIGSNSGVNPIATDNENTNALNQRPLVIPRIRKTMGNNIAINFTSTIEIDFAPSSKRLFLTTLLIAKLPYTVDFPKAITSPSALPPTTLVPKKAKAVAFFSTMPLSPVITDWDTKKSDVSNNFTSAGILSPASNTILSPNFNCSELISITLLSFNTLTFVLTNFNNLSVIIFALNS